MAWTARPVRLLPALFVIALATPAHAEGERALSLGLGWATFSTPGVVMGSTEPPAVTPDIGGALTVTYEQAVGSDFSLRGELSGGLYYGGETEKQSAMSYSALLDGGIVYRFDVLKYVPYAFGGIGGVATSGGPIASGVDFVLTVGGGLDVLVSRAHSYGIEGRLASFGGDVTIFTVGFRATTRWGYF